MTPIKCECVTHVPGYVCRRSDYVHITQKRFFAQKNHFKNFETNLLSALLIIFSVKKGKREKSLSLSVSFLYILKVMPLLATPTMKNMRVNMA